MAIDDRGFLIDRSTQTWVRATGTVVSLDAHPWLRGPTGGTRIVADQWLPSEAERLGGAVVEGGGLLDDFDRLSVRVMFPMPNGSVAVFLRPGVRDDGALTLTSPLGSFGDDGAYLIVARAERFVVWVDEEGTLRTDHALSLWQVPVLRFHYRLERRMDTGPR